MGMMGTPNPYGQPYGQNASQTLGSSGLGQQNKGGLGNSLPQFTMEKKPAGSVGMPNLVSDDACI